MILSLMIMSWASGVTHRCFVCMPWVFFFMEIYCLTYVKVYIYFYYGADIEVYISERALRILSTWRISTH
jgi:hypothetical protein